MTRPLHQMIKTCEIPTDYNHYQRRLAGNVYQQHKHQWGDCTLALLQERCGQQGAMNKTMYCVKVKNVHALLFVPLKNTYI